MYPDLRALPIPNLSPYLALVSVRWYMVSVSRPTCPTYSSSYHLDRSPLQDRSVLFKKKIYISQYNFLHHSSKKCCDDNRTYNCIISSCNDNILFIRMICSHADVVVGLRAS